jgi:nucleolar complex protein 3
MEGAEGGTDVNSTCVTDPPPASPTHRDTPTNQPTNQINRPTNRQALVPRMAVSDPDVGASACAAIRDLLSPDVLGSPALEALQLVADLVRKKNCGTQARVVEVLLVLKLKEVAPPPADDGTGKGGAAPAKKKRRKKKGQLERDLEEGEAGPDREEQARLQTKILEVRGLAV